MDVLREPILKREPMLVPHDVVAALSAEVMWLCRSGELDKLYEVYPCFNSRSAALEALFKEQRVAMLAQRFRNRQVLFVAHCHSDCVSLVLQVMDVKGRPTPAADETIGLRLREGLNPDGSAKMETQRARQRTGEHSEV